MNLKQHIKQIIKEEISEVPKESYLKYEKLLDKLVDDVFMDFVCGYSWETFNLHKREGTQLRIILYIKNMNDLDFELYGQKKQELLNLINDFFPKFNGVFITTDTTKCGEELNESEITERCWKGYTQKGMKTMFGKRYPNCVKIKKKKESKEGVGGYAAPAFEMEPDHVHFKHLYNEGFLDDFTNLFRRKKINQDNPDFIDSERQRFTCTDCGEYDYNMYMVNDDIWNEYGNKKDTLCMSCLEKRMGRKLTKDDFYQHKDIPVNKHNPEVKDVMTESIRRILREETKTNSSLRRLLNMLFDGFDNIDYDWANYNCGMGECCDPYAIGFTLPMSDYDDYIFKLVDSDNYDDDSDYPKEFQDELPEPCYQQPDLKDPKFDTIVFYGLYAEEIQDYVGNESNWSSDLLKIINNQFGCDAKRIVII